MGHGGSLNKVRNRYALYERAANNMRSKVDVVTTIRTGSLAQAVHDEQAVYTIPSDFGKIIDLHPSGKRTSGDFGRLTDAVSASLLKQIRDKQIAVESRDGVRVLFIDWQGNKVPKTLAQMNSAIGWSATAGAANVESDSLFAISGGRSVRFDLTATGGGIENTTLDALDLSDWTEQADFFAWVYFPAVTNLTSVQARWGNDMTTNYWQSTAQTTQADGTAFQTGWNLVKFSWAGATETGTVDDTVIDSFRLYLNTTGAISDVRVDNIVVSLGSIFDIKYYGAYMFRTAAGAWIRRPTVDTDSVAVDEQGFNIFAYECLIEMAQQMEGEDSNFDISFALRALNGDGTSRDPAQRLGLYARYRKEYPSLSKPVVMSYWNSRR
jgi:hypothetical protein